MEVGSVASLPTKVLMDGRRDIQANPLSLSAVDKCRCQGNCWDFLAGLRDGLGGSLSG